jgi:hypothetical protein
MDVTVHPEAGLLRIGPGPEVGRRDQPDVASFVAFADRFQPDEIGIFLGVGLEQARQFVVAIEFVEAGLGHPDLDGERFFSGIDLIVAKIAVGPLRLILPKSTNLCDLAAPSSWIWGSAGSGSGDMGIILMGN